MKSEKNVELNFKKLITYYEVPSSDGPFPFRCTGFCTSCEQRGFLDEGEHRLDQMSHGADSSDFENLMGPLPEDGFKKSIVFLLESPGGYYGNGKQVTCDGVTKQPPVNAYYWVPREKSGWPVNSEIIDPKSYGPYFAYLIKKYCLKNAYFTNIVKCSLAERNRDKFKDYYVASNPKYRDSKIRDNCFQEILKNELLEANPKIIFAFGEKASRMATFVGVKSLFPDVEMVTLYHPAARKKRSVKVSHNDSLIAKALEKIG